MSKKFKKVWKKCDGQWLRSHPKWLRAGDYFMLENDQKVFMATADPEVDSKGDFKIKHIIALLNKNAMRDMNT